MSTQFENGVLVCAECGHRAKVHFVGVGCMDDEPCTCEVEIVPRPQECAGMGCGPTSPCSPECERIYSRQVFDSVPQDAQNGAVEPSLAYGGTQGHSGTSTSRERAVEDVRAGKAAERQATVLRHLERIGVHGITVKEVRERTGWHHGQASAALTNLHIAGKIVRLTEQRDRCMVYVTPGDVAGRTVSPYVPQRRNRRVVLDRDEVYKVISDSFYEARNKGRTMDMAAHAATERVMEMIDRG